MTPREETAVFQTAVEQLRQDRGIGAVFVPRVETPIVRDMRRTAREFGIVSALLEHQRVVYAEPAKCYDLVESVLLSLGVSNAELLANLQDRKGDK